MGINKRFILKLAFLIIPFVILTLILLDGTGGGGVGGGGYDLSGLVYGLALFACIGIWMLFILIGLLRSESEQERKSRLWLLALGCVALVSAWFITPRMF